MSVLLISADKICFAFSELPLLPPRSLYATPPPTAAPEAEPVIEPIAAVKFDLSFAVTLIY